MHSGTKLFGQDIVQKISDPQYIGVVVKCWHDEDHVQPETSLADPLLKPLKYGEVGVSFISHNGAREILHETELHLLDRALQLGDYCKRSLEDFRSGVVTGIKVKGRLHHAISHEDVPGWFTAQDLKDRIEAEVGDYVAHDDWIGQIVEVFDECIIQLSSGQLVRLPELGSRLNVGERGPHVLPPPDIGVQQVFNFFARGDGGENDTVLFVKHNTYAVAWLALNQSLDSAVYEQKPRPQRFWHGEDLSKLSLILSLSVLEVRLGDRVELKNPTGLPLTQHGQDCDPTGVLCVQIFRVKETETTVDVLWQDGSRETLKATDLIPYLNPDENDCWPGDQIVLKDEDTERPGVVQSVDAVERTASLLFPDTMAIELASLLQLDTHGNPDQAIDGGVAVRLGDFVFIHKVGETNGSVGSRVPRIGEVEHWVREQTYDDEEMTGWRKAMHDIGRNIAAQRGITGQVEKSLHRPVRGSGELAWCGEVTALILDGTVQVTHPDFSVGVYPLNRLTRLYDGIEQLENDVWGEGDAGNEYLWAMDESGDWQPAEEGSGDWEDVSDEDPSSGHNHGDAEMNINEEAELQPSDPSPISHPPIADTKMHLEQTESSEESIWTPFRILSSAPVDHAFYNAPPAQPPKLFMTRLRKEYRVLDSSLPETIVVRAYEDRADLLRSLIIGPENTPYADAPFVIDWMLDSDFPNSPPKAHFLSWTNGNGRVNPNLYEEGKVCLSLLGTWQGDKHEVWSAQRSSILQALISVQGLVLVKEPWFCEPAYEKLRGTPDATVNSRLYSEKAYILSRGFVSRALGLPLGSLQDELDYLYHQHGRLQKVIDDAQALVDKSRTSWEASDENWGDCAIPKLTAGGIIILERILKKLRTQSRNKPLLTPSVSHESSL